MDGSASAVRLEALWKVEHTTVGPPGRCRLRGCACDDLHWHRWDRGERPEKEKGPLEALTADRAGATAEVVWVG